MPTYSYRCTGCGVEFDVQQAFSDSALTTCEACGGALRKLFSAVGVTFNGSGFYRTDSRQASQDKKSSGATSPKSSDGASSSESASGSSSSTPSTSSPAKTTSAPSQG